MNYLHKETMEVFTYLLLSKQNKPSYKLISVYDKVDDGLCQIDAIAKIHDDIAKNKIKALFEYDEECKNRLYLKLIDTDNFELFLKKYIDAFKQDRLEIEPKRFPSFDIQLKWLNKILNYYFNEGKHDTFVICSNYKAFSNLNLKLPDDVKLLELLLVLYFSKKHLISIISCNDSDSSEIETYCEIDNEIKLLMSPDEIMIELEKERNPALVDYNIKKTKTAKGNRTYLVSYKTKETYITKKKLLVIFNFLIKNNYTEHLTIGELLKKIPTESKKYTPEKNMKTYIQDINSMLKKLHNSKKRAEFIKIKKNEHGKEIIQINIP